MGEYNTSDYSAQYVTSLEESIENLQEEVTRVRGTNRLLRNINHQLRGQVAIAHANDEAFKDFCQQEIEVDAEPEGGLPEGTLSQSGNHEC